MTTTTPTTAPDLLRKTELARAARCSRTYLWSACRSGFVMPGGRATLAEFRQWLREHPDFRANAPRRAFVDAGERA